MAVLIEGMEMPKEGYYLLVFPSGRVLEVFEETRNIGREAKAVPVPEPHGRLIDADALDVVLKNEAESLDVNVYACGIADGLSLARSCIETASTIIPANGEG